MRRAATLALLLIASGGCGAVGSGGSARVMWEENCQRCHGADGRGVLALRRLEPRLDLTKSDTVRRGVEARLRQVIAVGAEGMPGFGHKLSGGDIEELVALVRRFASEEER